MRDLLYLGRPGARYSRYLRERVSKALACGYERVPVRNLGEGRSPGFEAAILLSRYLLATDILWVDKSYLCLDPREVDLFDN